MNRYLAVFFDVLVIFLFFLTGCGEKYSRVNFELLKPSKTGVLFKNTVIETDSVNVVSFTNIYNGGGVGVADFNKDDRADLFFTGNMVSSALYLNRTAQGEIRFENVSEQAGIYTDRWATGVSIADINNDGWPDIYICVSGNKDPEKRKNYLFIHQGLNSDKIPVFREMASSYGLDDRTYSTQAAFFDYDLDNDLDLFVAVNFADQFYGATVNIPTPNKKGYTERSDRLYENRGIGPEGHPVFVDVSERAGILHEGYTLGLVIQDIDLDGWPDIYEANDFLSNDILYMNQGDGTFVNKIGDYFRHTTFAGMGMDISDYNNDGWQDIFVLDMTPADNLRQKSMMLPVQPERYERNLRSGYFPQYNRNTLQLNNGPDPNGNLSFSEIGQLAGVHHTDWSWTGLFVDLNNNGLRDLIVGNGFRRDMQDIDNIHFMFGDNPFGTRENWEKEFVQRVKEIPGIYINNYVMENNGDLTFTDRSDAWGISHPSYTNGGAFADLDNDGDLDIIFNNLNDHPFIYENKTNDKYNTSANYLKIRFPGNIINAENIGARISLTHGNTVQYHQHYIVRGYLSSMDPVVHFGLGNDTVVTELQIQWPDGKCSIYENINANRIFEVKKDDLICQHTRSDDPENPLFEDVSYELQIPYVHKEFDYEDFIYQPLLLNKHSSMGPGLAVGDINGDSLDDLVAGGARGQKTAILTQTPEGNFVNTPIEGSLPFEDTGVLLLDADNDGDQDLYVVSGSTEYGFNTANYQDRIYINDGRGNFYHDETALPEIISSGNCVLSADIDLDGDLDLFIGGLIKPREFPRSPSSYILLNESEKGKVKFLDKTESWGHAIREIGMVTTGLFSDFNDDGLVDLILAGRWMPVSIFINTGEKFEPVDNNTGLEYSNGLWNSINGADIDKDGDTDYILGNLGSNSWLKASKEEPLSIYADDFDRNGEIDPLVFHYVHGRNVPFHPRPLVISQLAYLEKIYPTYSDFATAGLNDILDEDQQENADKLWIYELRSCYMENLGDNCFTLRPLPGLIQSAPVYGTLIQDLDNDGHLDILITGNSNESNLTLGWYDANIGYMLKGDGEGNFSVIDGTESGFFIDTYAKSIVQFDHINFGTHIVVGNNNDSLSVFRRKIQPYKALKYDDSAVNAIFYNKNNENRKIELYRGCGYLSDGVNRVYVDKNISKVEFYNSSNQLLQSVSVD